MPPSGGKGSMRLDMIIAFGLVAVAGSLWFIQMGGEQGLADFMVELSWQLRQLKTLMPWF